MCFVALKQQFRITINYFSKIPFVRVLLVPRSSSGSGPEEHLQILGNLFQMPKRRGRLGRSLQSLLELLK